MAEFIIGDEDRKRKLPQLVLRALIEEGSTIEELASRKNLKNIPVGDPAQIPHQSKYIWHNKSEIDNYVKDKLSITDDEWNIGDSNRPSNWYTYVAEEISKLRNDGTITDWNPELRTGIWRLTYLKGISPVEPTVDSPNCWIYSVTPENWEVIKEKNIWASKIDQKIRDRIRPGDKVIFYVLGTHEFQGIFEFFEEWYDAQKPVWDDEDNSILYTSQIKLKPLNIGSVNVYDVASKLKVFTNPDDKRLINLVLKGGGGYPSNNGKPILYEDYQILFELMNTNDPTALDKDPETTLPLLSSKDIDEGYDLISKELFIPKEKIIEIIIALLSGRHVLLAGPIGTGKTRLASLIPEIFWKKRGGYASEVHTATSDWSTLDVIGGIMPKMENDKPKYVIQKGCVVSTVIKNSMVRTDHSDYTAIPYMGTWLVIDEFNRADIDKAFGQLFTALRTRNLKIPSNKVDEYYDDLKISKDYRIIGTLNTADKHFLFKLSDALKSRFAYIEVDIVKREQFEEEIYYAIKNALYELELESPFDKIIFDDTNKKINKEKSDSDFYNRVMQAYAFLDTVRIFKKLGTAVLKLILQNLIMGVILTNNSKVSLDNALTSTLIPQLENMSSSHVSTIHAMHSDNLDSFLRNSYADLNKQNYVQSFEKILDYLDINNKEQIILDFEKSTIPNDSEVWNLIKNAFDKKKEKFELNLEQMLVALDDLKKSMTL